MKTNECEYKRGSLKDLLSEKDDAFFKLYKFTCSLPKLQSVLLSYLIDAEDLVKIRLDEDKDYFECCIEGFIHNLLSGLSTSEIRTALIGLEKGGYINRKNVHKGFKNSTFIKINTNAVLELRRAYLEVSNCEKWFYYAEDSYSTAREKLMQSLEESDVTTKRNITPPPKNAAAKRYY